MLLRRLSLYVASLLVATGLAQPAEAQLGSRSAEEWIETLESPNRIAGLKIADTIAALKLKPGEIVADIGAGSGVFTLPLARAVRPGGTAYAVEVDEKLLEHIMETGTEQGVANVQPVFAEFDDPLLPVEIDLAFIHDVLHHIEKRDVYLKHLAGYLKPSGRIAVIDFVQGRGGQRSHASVQSLSQEQVTALLAQVGLKPLEEIALFEDKWFVIYGRQ